MVIRRSWDRLISTMRFPILVRCRLYIESSPWCWGWNIQEQGQHHGCWCPGSLRRQAISSNGIDYLSHWGRVTHICFSDITIIGSDNDLSPGWHQAIIRTNAGILLIRPLGTNFSEILIEIIIFSFKKMRLKVSSAKRRPFCLCLNVLI